MNIFTGLQVKKKWVCGQSGFTVSISEEFTARSLKETIFILFHHSTGNTSIIEKSQPWLKSSSSNATTCSRTNVTKKSEKILLPGFLSHPVAVVNIFGNCKRCGAVNTLLASVGGASPLLYKVRTDHSASWQLHCWPPPGLRAPALTSYGDACHTRSRLRPTPGKIPWSNGFHPLPPWTSP